MGVASLFPYAMKPNLPSSHSAPQADTGNGKKTRRGNDAYVPFGALLGQHATDYLHQPNRTAAPGAWASQLLAVAP